MAVNEEVSALSTTAASNTPAGASAVGPDLDNHLRDIKKNIRRSAEHFKGSTEGNFPGAIKVDESASPTWTVNIRGTGQDIALFSIDDSAGISNAIVGGVAPSTFTKSTFGDGTASARTKIVGPLDAVVAEGTTASAKTSFLGALIRDASDEGTSASARTSLIGPYMGAAADEDTTASASQVLHSGPLGFYKYFASSEQTVTADTQLDVAHSLGGVPVMVQIILRCKTGELGYSAGDEVSVSSVVNDISGDVGATIFSDATNVSIVQGASFRLHSRATFNEGNVTPANWRWVIRAWA